MDPRLDSGLRVARRRFLGQAGVGIGMAALAELLQCDLLAQSDGCRTPQAACRGCRTSRRRPSG